MTWDIRSRDDLHRYSRRDLPEPDSHFGLDNDSGASMDQIEHPSNATWNQRREWFEGLFDEEARGGAYVIGEHALGLLVDLQAIYCAGAFVSVIIIFCTLIDAHPRESELAPSFDGGIKEAFLTSVYNSDLEWLRRRRNELVHLRVNKPLAISVEDQWSRRIVHEADAQRAIELIANVLFENPWI
jgi:hypothetical protein